jgi:hypothetical protein
MKKISDLTDNFGRWEFFVSRDYPHLAGGAMYSRDIDKIDDRLYLLAKFILQPIRDKFGKVDITSGYRDRDLNKAVGGKDNSLHLRGKAADIVVEDLEGCFKFIKTELQEFISECYLGDGFIHVALADIFKRRQDGSN